MLKKHILFIIVIISYISLSQNAEDVLRYSLYNNYTTARVSALGGSFGSLGGNIGAVTLNPATLGIYRTEEISITLASDNETIQSEFDSEGLAISYAETNRYKFFIQNLSYVKSIPIDGDWNRINMSVNLNRSRDLNRQIYIEGMLPASSSMVNNFFLSQAEGLDPYDLNYFDGTASAYWTNLIDLDTINNEYFSNFAPEGINNRLTLDETGYINEYSFSFSGSYKDFLFVGLSVNFLDMSFQQYKRYSESSILPYENGGEEFIYNTDLSVTGEGGNFKIGAILKPIPSIRIGWSYHSPTYYSLYELYTSDMTFNSSDGTMIDYFDPDLDSEQEIHEGYYDIITPVKTVSSLAFIFAKKGLITVDYETLDYGSARFEPDLNWSYSQENTDISDSYTKTYNIKAGIEWKFKKMAIRSGYARYGSPFENDLNDGSRQYMSAGIGLQNGPYFIDIAVIQSLEEEYYTLYNDQAANIKNNGTTIMLSCSYEF